MRISSNYNISYLSKAYGSGISNKTKKAEKQIAKQTVNPPINKTSGKPIPFGSIYIEDSCNVSTAIKPNSGSDFTTRDALLLNRIANIYPYQDCFIVSGYGGWPALKYREKPVEVQKFTKSIADEYKYSIDPDDEEYQSVYLILHPDEQYTNFLGVPSFISTNPSLPNTVMAGYEIHKKLLSKKFQIMKKLGKNEIVHLGHQNITESAYKQIEGVEMSVKRYLMEQAYAVFNDRPKADQIYASNYPKIQPRLADERVLELTTSAADLDDLKRDNVFQGNVTYKQDICKEAVTQYPDYNENKKRIYDLARIMDRLTNYPWIYV